MVKKAAELHLLACYVLHCMKDELKAKGAIHDFRKDNRLVYEEILFLCGDTLRTEVEQDLGLQTKICAPSKDNANWRITHETIRCVLKQCLEQGWLIPPGSKNINYELTKRGQNMIGTLIEGRGMNSGDGEDVAFLSPAIMLTLKDKVKRWLAVSKSKLDAEVRDSFKRAYQSPILVAHYDMSDPAFRPYLSGELSI